MLLLGALMGARAFLIASPPPKAMSPRLALLGRGALRTAGRRPGGGRSAPPSPAAPLFWLQRRFESGPPSYHRSPNPLPEFLTMAAAVESVDSDKIIDGKAGAGARQHGERHGPCLPA